MSSSWEEQDRSVSSRRGATRRARVLGPMGWNGIFPLREDLYSEERTEINPYTNYTPKPCTNYTPKPGGGCKRLTWIELSGSNSIMTPPHGAIFIFVQGKKSACIVTRDLGKDKDEKILNVKMNFGGLADSRLGEAAIFGHEIKQPAEMYPYAVVSVLLSSDDLNEEKRFKPLSHKESSSRPPLNEEAAINFLKQKLVDDGFKKTIQTAISALQCLYQENVKADEIEVYTAHLDTAHLDNSHKFLSRGEIEMHLAASST